MSELEELRREIDGIDSQIVRLLEERLACAEKVGAYKVKNGMAVLDASREEQLLESRVAMLQDASLAPYCAELFTLLMRLSRERQAGVVDNE